MTMVPVALLASLMGLSLGLLGGGGSILAVPLLHYVGGLGAREAIAGSLLVVGATSAACALEHARAGFVDLRTGLLFGVVAMAGAYVGGRLAQFVPAQALLLLFVAVMVTAGLAMLRRRSRGATSEANSRRSGGWKARIALQGLAVGLLTGLVGAGGGFLIVPALVLLGGLEMRVAVGTSSLVIALNAGAGFMGHMGRVTLDRPLLGWVLVSSLVGALAGTTLAHRMDAVRLKVVFGSFVLVVAGLIAYREGGGAMLAAIAGEHWPF